jgi:hypothetical protein
MNRNLFPDHKDEGEEMHSDRKFWRTPIQWRRD